MGLHGPGEITCSPTRGGRGSQRVKHDVTNNRNSTATTAFMELIYLGT
jgi:hypothetical protein